jgi:hypothetical protein
MCRSRLVRCTAVFVFRTICVPVTTMVSSLLIGKGVLSGCDSAGQSDKLHDRQQILRKPLLHRWSVVAMGAPCSFNAVITR